MDENNKIPRPIDGQNRIIETYADDMAQVIENDKEGLVKKIIQGEEKHEMEKKNLSPNSAKNKLFTSLGAVLLLMACAVLFFLLINRNIQTVQVENPFVPIISSDQSDFAEIGGLSKDEIITTIQNGMNKAQIKEKGVEGIYLTENKKIVGLRRFLALTKSSLILGDSNLVKDDFMMGAINDTNKDFFILIKVRALPDIFETLRVFEGKMLSDLHGLFKVDITPETNYLFTKNFNDGIVENKNARILYDKDNKIVLMYIFADDNSVIITNTPEAAHEIMLRLSSSQIKK